MSSIGLNIARDGHIPIDVIRSLNVTWVRVVAMPGIDLSDYLLDLKVSGISILLVLARESGGDFARYQRLYGSLVDAVQVGNEADLSSPSSWTMTQAELVSLGKAARKMFPSTPLVCAGLASGHPEWLDGVDLSWCDALAFHPYLKDAPNPNDIEDLQDVDGLVAGYGAYGKPLLITEWGWWDDKEPRASEEVEDFTEWAGLTGDIEVFFYFCAADSMVPPFGLLDAKLKDKPRAPVFREQAAKAIHSLWPEVSVPVTPPTDLRAYARTAAEKAGIPPGLFERQIQQESGFDLNAYNVTSGATGIAQIIPRFHPGVDPTDPIASLDYAAAWMGRLWRQYGSYRRALAAYNWGPGNVSTWDGSASTLPSETRHYLDVIMGPGWPEPSSATGRITYDRQFPATIQDDDWSCAPSSLDWALRALGRTPGHSYIENLLVHDGIVSVQDGLLDATGGPLAAWIGKKVPAEVYYGADGFYGNNEPVISFSALAAEFAPACTYPALIGGRNFGGPGKGHWVGLRVYDPVTDRLQLANPAGSSGIFAAETLTRSQFATKGPFSLVRVLHPDIDGSSVVVPPVPPPSVLPTRSEVAAVIAKLDDIMKRLPA